MTGLAVPLALRARQGEAEAALARLEMLDPDGGELGPAQGAGEADQQQGAVAPATQIVRDRRQDLVQQVGRGGQFLGR